MPDCKHVFTGSSRILYQQTAFRIKAEFGLITKGCPFTFLRRLLKDHQGGIRPVYFAHEFVKNITDLHFAAPVFRGHEKLLQSSMFAIEREPGGTYIQQGTEFIDI